jgi:osmotically-inducible protein OsmY
MITSKQDAALRDAVLRELRDDARVNAAEIGVAVAHGVVTLSGRVDTDAEKDAAQQAAHRAAGVIDVANDIHVKAPFRLGCADPDLAEAVRKALEGALHASAARIHSTICDAWVTLEGSVAAAREREAAARAVHRLAGVRGVDNRIVVRAAGSEPAVRGASDG